MYRIAFRDISGCEPTHRRSIIELTHRTCNLAIEIVSRKLTTYLFFKSNGMCLCRHIREKPRTLKEKEKSQNALQMKLEIWTKTRYPYLHLCRKINRKPFATSIYLQNASPPLPRPKTHRLMSIDFDVLQQKSKKFWLKTRSRRRFNRHQSL